MDNNILFESFCEHAGNNKARKATIVRELDLCIITIPLIQVNNLRTKTKVLLAYTEITGCRGLKNQRFYAEDLHKDPRTVSHMVQQQKSSASRSFFVT